MALVGGVGRLGTVQPVTYTGTAAMTTNGAGNGVHVVRVVATTDCYIRTGPSPTATTSDTFLPAKWPEYINVMPGEKVSAVQAASGGVLYVTEIP